jgi:hypothetical protein
MNHALPEGNSRTSLARTRMTVKMCSSYRKFEPSRSRKFREKKKVRSDQEHFNYTMITDAQ